MTVENKIDLGSIQIHKKVIADIAYSAINEIEGVSLASPGISSRLFGLFNKSDYPGISVVIDKESQVVIEVGINVHYGINIPDIARQVQDVIRVNIEKIADVNLKDVNVNIQGIERGGS